MARFKRIRAVQVILIVVSVAGSGAAFGAPEDAVAHGPPEPARAPILRTIDLDVGESVEVALADGSTASVKLVGLAERRDSLRDGVREARVTVEVNGVSVDLVAAGYNLPRSVAGVQIDAAVTRAYYSNAHQDAWGLDKDARLRLWPAGSPWFEPGTFVYPVRQRWFASATQMANEPTWVDGVERPGRPRIYYHDALDFGGAAGLDAVVSASDGLVVSSAGATLPGYEDTPVNPRYDEVYVVDDRGWYYRYSHLQTIDTRVRPGHRIAAGQPVGHMGREGDAGGWTHLHFAVAGRQPSGKWGAIESYPFIWQAYQEEHRPRIIAVARPHHLAAVGETVLLDGSRSWSADGAPLRFDWTFHDGSTAAGAQVERTYSRSGAYSEVLRVTDSDGNVGYDFAVVQVLDRERTDLLPPALHAAYHPTFGIRPGHPVRFLVRVFETSHGNETWDFGDGSPPVEVRSRDGAIDPWDPDGYAETVHSFSEPGHYVVRVERANERGEIAMAHLHVVVDE